MGQLLITPLAGLGEVNPVTADLQTAYNGLRGRCIDNFGVEFCNSVLPSNVFNAMGRPQPQALKWWMWFAGGIIIGKLIL